MGSYRYTFLLPAYKSQFFAEALTSIKSQTYTDFKVLISDDCSPENLKEIYSSLCHKDNRFSFRRNEENIGGKSLVSHWNHILGMCESEYVIFASDDDVYSPFFLEEIDTLVNRYPEVDIFRAKAKRIQDGSITQEDGEIPEFLTQEEFLEYFGEKTMVHCLANYVFKTSALKAMGGFPDFPKAGYSDAATAMALSKNSIVTTRNILFSFRISEVNLSSCNGYSKYTEEGIIGCVMFADWYKEYIKPFVNSNGDVKQAHYNHVVEVAQFFLCHLSLPKAIKYYWKLRMRGYMNFKSTLTAIKNWVKISM